MTTYTAYFCHGRKFAPREFEADSPQEALALAQAYDLGKLWHAPDGHVVVDEIAIHDPDGKEVAAWLNEALRLWLAAGDLPAALERAIVALNTAPRFAVPALGIDSYKVAALCERALAKAKG